MYKKKCNFHLMIFPNNLYGKFCFYFSFICLVAFIKCHHPMLICSLELLIAKFDQLSTH